LSKPLPEDKQSHKQGSDDQKEKQATEDKGKTMMWPMWKVLIIMIKFLYWFK
jgi:hypothetical protein